MNTMFNATTAMALSLVILNFVGSAHGDDTGPFQQPTYVVFETNRGTIEIKLLPEIAPQACVNMVELVEKGYYNGTIFHRVIKDFMIQGGDPTGTGMGGKSTWGSTFKDEVTGDIKFDREGLLAMANAGPNTNGSQFFITTVPTPWLNMKHTIFGSVTKGFEIVQAIENTAVDNQDRPAQEQKIIKAFIKKEPNTSTAVEKF